MVAPPLYTAAVIANNYKYREFFSDCMGTYDGTHCSGFTSDCTFRNKKQKITQNVFASVNFDETFSFVLCGWEGKAHDAQVLGDACTKGFIRRPGKYYLADAGYSLNSFSLTPYRGVKYHLKEWINSGLQPENAKELFNLRHSSLRNVAERTIGIVKKRFPILTKMNGYKMKTQVKLVMSCFLLHNFIRQNQDFGDFFISYSIH